MARLTAPLHSSATSTDSMGRAPTRLKIASISWAAIRLSCTAFQMTLANSAFQWDGAAKSHLPAIRRAACSPVLDSASTAAATTSVSRTSLMRVPPRSPCGSHRGSSQRQGGHAMPRAAPPTRRDPPPPPRESIVSLSALSVGFVAPALAAHVRRERGRCELLASAAFSLTLLQSCNQSACRSNGCPSLYVGRAFLRQPDRLLTAMQCSRGPLWQFDFQG